MNIIPCEDCGTPVEVEPDEDDLYVDRVVICTLCSDKVMDEDVDAFFAQFNNVYTE
tara:strand:- start:79 stop:246 length:168 start_codon:yes stop_codon:yes gene_type:complete